MSELNNLRQQAQALTSRHAVIAQSAQATEADRERAKRSEAIITAAVTKAHGLSGDELLTECRQIMEDEARQAFDQTLIESHKELSPHEREIHFKEFKQRIAGKFDKGVDRLAALLGPAQERIRVEIWHDAFTAIERIEFERLDSRGGQSDTS